MFAHRINWKLVVITHIIVSVCNLALPLILYVLGFFWNALLDDKVNVKGLFTGHSVVSQVFQVALSLVPVIGGGIYLASCLTVGFRKHTIAFSTIFLATTLLTALALFDDGFSAGYLAYYAMIVPAALFGEFLGIKAKHRKVKKLERNSETRTVSPKNPPKKNNRESD